MELEEQHAAEPEESSSANVPSVESKNRLAKKERVRKLHEAAEAEEARSAQELIDAARDQAAAQPTGSEPETPPVTPMSPDCVITLMPGEMPALKGEICAPCTSGAAAAATPVEVQLNAAAAAAPRMRMNEKTPVVEPPTLEEYTSIEEAKALARHMLAPGLIKLSGKKGNHHKMRCCFSYAGEVAVAQVRAATAATGANALPAGLPGTVGPPAAPEATASPLTVWFPASSPLSLPPSSVRAAGGAAGRDVQLQAQPL